MIGACGGDDEDTAPDAGLRDPRPCTDFSNDADYRPYDLGPQCRVNLAGIDYPLFPAAGGPDQAAFIEVNRPDGSSTGHNTPIGGEEYEVDTVQWQGMHGKAVVTAGDFTGFRTCQWVNCE